MQYSKDFVPHLFKKPNTQARMQNLLLPGKDAKSTVDAA